MTRVLTLLATVAARLVAPGRPPVHAQDLRLVITTLSTRADLVTGGNVMIEVRIPQAYEGRDVRVRLDGTDVTDSLLSLDALRFVGVVDGLREGPNVLTA